MWEIQFVELNGKGDYVCQWYCSEGRHLGATQRFSHPVLALLPELVKVALGQLANAQWSRFEALVERVKEREAACI